MAKRVTLLDPPPQDHSKALIENVLDLTPVVDLGPVRLPPFAAQHSFLNTDPFLASLGCLHQYPTAMAPAGSPRHLRWRRDRAVVISRHADCPYRFRRSQHALLLRSCRRLRNPYSISRRTGARWPKLRDPDRAGATARPPNFHHHPELQPRRQRRREDYQPCSPQAGYTTPRRCTAGHCSSLERCERRAVRVEKGRHCQPYV